MYQREYDRGPMPYQGISDSNAPPADWILVSLKPATVDVVIDVALVDIWGHQIPNQQYNKTVVFANGTVTLYSLLGFTSVTNPPDNAGWAGIPDGAVGAILSVKSGGVLYHGYGANKDGTTIVAGSVPFIPLKIGAVITLARINPFNILLLA